MINLNILSMKIINYVLCAVCISAVLWNCKTDSTMTEKEHPFKYPETKTCDSFSVYFGDTVQDPYRWLEDDRSAETEAWVKSQQAFTGEYLSKIPFRDSIKKFYEKVWDYPKFSAPSKKGNYYFEFRNNGMQNQSVLYKMKTLTDEGEICLDPNTFSEDGTTALTGFAVSKDSKHAAYGIQKGGSDWNEMFVMELENNTKLEDHIKWVKFSSIAWCKNGFYYSRYDKPEGSELSAKNEFHKVYYHIVGTSQSNDKLVWEDKDNPARNFYASTTEDERFLILSSSESTSGNALKVQDLSKNNAPIVDITPQDFQSDYNVVDNIDDKLYVLTNADAPKYKLVKIDVNKPEKENWETIIPEGENVLKNVELLGGKLFAYLMENVSSKVYAYDLSGQQLYAVELPGIGAVEGMNGSKDSNEAFYTFRSFTTPGTTYKYNVETNKSEVYRKSQLQFNSDEYVTKQVFYTSKDGTKVPMFVTHKKGLQLDGTNPTLLYGYGGFNISLTPSFSMRTLMLLQNGGVYAVANIRGGGEYGEKWHKDGTLLQKQNVFDDFIAAAEYLISEKYTSSEKLGLLGGSNGGLLIGACMTQRPDLFKVAFPAVGVLDMLRYHKFTIGWAWATDYGKSEDSKEMFEYLYNYSPVHNVKPNTKYPATMVMTADHDDRVVPAHSFKFIAQLQKHQTGKNPVLIRIETMAGHGAGKPTSKTIEELADLWSFFYYNIGETPKFE